MNEINELASINYYQVIVSVFVVLLAVKTIIEIFSYYRNKFGIKTKIDTAKENLEQRICKLEKNGEWQYKELLKIAENIKKLDESFASKQIADMRWELLDFCSALTGGRKYNLEAYKHIFKTYEDYERILKENDLTNGYVTESMKVVKEFYRDKLSKGEL